MSDLVRSKEVLIVEDDLIISRVLEHMIRKIGHNVVNKETSGQGAIQSAFELKPELILMDIQLKGDMDGISATQRIQSKYDVPVIYITGNSDRYSYERALKTNFIDYFVKPIRLKQLQKSINKAFSKQHTG